MNVTEKSLNCYLVLLELCVGIKAVYSQIIRLTGCQSTLHVNIDHGTNIKCHGIVNFNNSHKTTLT
jgi:hypothetical protein